MCLLSGCCSLLQFFAHLLATDAISWGTLSNIVLTEDATTSSARIFIKILFQVRRYSGPAHSRGNIIKSINSTCQAALCHLFVKCT